MGRPRAKEVAVGDVVQANFRPRVLLLMDASGDRTVLHRWLECDFDVVDGLSDEAIDSYFDLCFVDGSAYQRIWHRLGDRRLMSEPVFLPFVLLTTEATAPLVAHLPTHDIDEVLAAPIERHVLLDRVHVLLARRDHEREMARERDKVLARLEESNLRLNRELERSSFLQDVAAAGATTLELGAICERVLDLARERLGVVQGGIYHFDSRKDTLVKLALLGYPDDLAADFDVIPLDERTAVGGAIIRRTILTHDAPIVPPPTRSKSALLGPDIRWVALPITTRNEIVGAIVLGFEGKRPFDDSELAVYQSMADLLGVAMLNAQLYQEERESARMRAVLDEVSRMVHRSLDFEEIMKTTVEKAAAAMDVDAATVGLTDEHGPSTWYGHGIDPSALRARLDDSLALTELQRTGQPVVMDDVESDLRKSKLAQMLDVKSMLLVPLIVREKLLGWLGFLNMSRPHVFTPLQVDFASRLAAQVSLALENSKAYQTERHIADTLQAALLVLPESIEGVSFAHDYRSAAEAARVGGDFYDVFDLGRGRVGLLIGDVSGKGLEASVMTSLARNSVRAYAAQFASPACVLERASQILLATSGPEIFVSAFFGVLNLGRGVLHYSNAGHPPPMLLRSDGRVTPLGSTGPVLGAWSNPPFAEDVTMFCSGDILLCYTDGLTEARPGRGRELYGDERLEELLASAQPTTPQETLDVVLQSVTAFAEGDLGDDMALLAIKVEGAPAPPC